MYGMRHARRREKSRMSKNDRSWHPLPTGRWSELFDSERSRTSCRPKKKERKTLRTVTVLAVVRLHANERARVWAGGSLVDESCMHVGVQKNENVTPNDTTQLQFHTRLGPLPLSSSLAFLSPSLHFLSASRTFISPSRSSLLSSISPSHTCARSLPIYQCAPARTRTRRHARARSVTVLVL